MSDDFQNTEIAPAAMGAVKKQGFLSTTTGKIVAIIGGLTALGIIAGVAAAIIIGVLATQAVDDLLVQPGQQPPSGTVEQTPAAAAEAPAPEIRNSEIFTARDIFDPLLEPLPEPSATSTTTPSATDTETPYAQGVLYLDGVVTEDGILKAELRYNGTTYTLGPGEGIPGTPWEVLRVSSTSVTMLYGDVQVTLAVGQGITK